MLNKLLGELASTLVPDPREIADAEKVANSLVKDLHKDADSPMIRVVRTEPFGSLSRATALDGFSDIDKLVILDSEALRTQAGTERTPRDTIARLASAVERQRALHLHLGSITVRRQDHSVGVVYEKRGYRVDLVPAINTRGVGLRVPERSSRDWIPCIPGTIGRQVDRADQKGSTARKAILLFKAWRRRLGRDRLPIPSYALELWVSSRVLAVRRQPLDALVVSLFEQLAEQNMQHRLVLCGVGAPTPVTCIDPGTGANVTEAMSYANRVSLVSNARDAIAVLSAVKIARDARAARTAAKALRALFPAREPAS